MKTVVLLAALVCLAPARSASQPAAIMPLVTLSGAHSHVTDERCLRVTTQEEWSALWLEHLGEPPNPKYSLYFNKAGLPVVDFAKCMVIAVFGGATENTAGLSAVEAPEPPVKQDEATAAGPGSADELALYLRWHGYQTGGPAPDGGVKHVEPFAFFVVPRTDAPLVVRDVQHPMGGGAPRVTHRARLPALQADGR